MAEFNPYKLEEEKWTPKNVYEILPPNAVSWSDYDFGQGTDNVDREAASKSFIDGFVDFFSDLLGTAGQILGGALELGGKVLGGFVNGVVNLIGGIANAIGSIFGGGPTESPYPPMFSPIKANLEAAVQPLQDKIDESLDKSRDLLAEQLVLSGQIAEQVDITRAAVADAKAASDRAGVAIGEAEAALAAAEDARETLEDYNTELNKRITSEFNAAVGRADTAVEKADGLIEDLSNFKQQHQREIDEAIGKAEQAAGDLAAISPQVEDAIDKAAAATDNVAALTPQVSDAVDKAGEASDQAIKALNSPQTGSSILPMVPGTATPTWTEPLRENSRGSNTADSVLPESVSHHYRWTGGMIPAGTLEKVEIPYENVVTVDPNMEYEASWYIRSSAGSPRHAYITFESPETGQNCVEKSEDGEASRNTWGNPMRPLITPVTTTWTKQTSRFKFKPGTRSVRLVDFEFNNQGNDRNSYIYIADLQVAPKVPNQKKVDEAQNNAIESLNILAAKQEDWNDAVDRSLATQETVNDNFRKWTDGAAEAIEANKNAIKALNAPQIGSSIIPLVPGTDIPVWQSPLQGLTRKISAEGDRVLPEKVPLVWRYGNTKIPAGGVETIRFSDTNVVAVDPAIEYEASWWTLSSNKNGNLIYLTLEDETGDRNIIEELPGGVSKYSWGNPVRAIITPVNSSWEKFTTRFKFKAGTRFVRFRDIQFNNEGNAEDSFLYIADLRMGPKVPTQQSVDDAQNDAISANTEALKALGKKVLGASLVPYKTPSTQEVEDYAAGKLSYDPWADPEYFGAGHKIVDTPRGRVARADTNHGSKSFDGSYVTVDSSVGYRVKFHTYANKAGTNLYIYMVDQNGDLALSETPFTNTTRTPGGLVHNLTLPTGVREWSGVIKFKEGTTQVKLGTFYWNHSNGSTTGLQEFGGLEIVPDIPDANVVNMLQDQAILENTQIGKENKKAIDALTEGLDAYVAAADLIATREEIQDELERQSIAREELEKKLNEAIVEAVPRTIIYDSGKPQFNDHFESLERTKVVAKKGWVGQMVLDTTWYNGDKTNRTIRTFPVPGTNDNRTYNVPSASFGSAHPEYRIDYWVYQGKSVQHTLSNSGAYLTGSTHKGNTWTQIATHTVKKTNGVVYFRWTTKLKKADRGRTYYFDVRVNGTSVIPKSFKGYGPLTSLGDGRATLTFSGTLNVPDNGKITVHTKSTGNATQAGVSSNKGIVSYLELE